MIETILISITWGCAIFVIGGLLLWGMCEVFGG